MIEISNQAVLYIGIAMYVIFMVGTVLEFRKMKKKDKHNSYSPEKDKEVKIRQINVSNY